MRPRSTLLTTALLLVLVGACSQTAGSTEAEPAPTAERLKGEGLSPTIMQLADKAGPRITSQVSKERISRSLQVLTERPRHAGSVGDLRSAEHLRTAFMAAGLEARLEEFEVLLPYPSVVTVELERPFAYRAAGLEAALDADYDTHTTAALPPFLAYAADGTVTAPVVFVNRGTDRDLQQLARDGVSIDGRLAVVRDSGRPAWQVARDLQALGCAGIILYADPADWGYGRGDTYPDGPWLPRHGARRRSLLDPTRCAGDPLTPGAAATREAHRIDIEAAAGLPDIPAAVLSAEDARPILESLKGATVPAGWQGGLPFPYHVGGTGAVQARLELRSDWRVRRIWNVVATLRGSAFPNEWVLVTAPRDAWVRGAADPGSSTALLLECARVLGTLAREGLRPSRSIVFCSWDGSAFGALGSNEHVDAGGKALLRSALVVIDVSGGAYGPDFEARASPSLGSLLRGTLASLPTGLSEGPRDLLFLAARSRLEPPTGWNDTAPFTQRLGLPCITLGTRGPAGVIGSLYDTYGWLKRFGDPDFKRIRLMTRITAALAWRAATASIVPFDIVALARSLRAALGRLAERHGAEALQALDEAAARLEAAALRMQHLRRAALERDPGPMSTQALSMALRRIPLGFGSAGGNLLFGTDPQRPARAVMLPQLAAALADRDAAAIESAGGRLLAAIQNGVHVAEEAARRLERIVEDGAP